MQDRAFLAHAQAELDRLGAEGLLKPERVLDGPQGARVSVDGGQALNLCANDYLGLANDPRVKQAAIDAVEHWGAGLASVRFICGTQAIHKRLEAAIARYLGYEDAILFAAAFDANGGVFEPLFGPEDAIVSDNLNHASIIDGVRLGKARRLRFASGDMADLERQLAATRTDGTHHVLIATDGVFSMDGSIADLAGIVALAQRYDALLMVDDCHATGVIGERGRGSASRCGVEGRIDILTGTFGKALGGAMGGFVCAKRPVIKLLRQKARPYLFSNTLAPAVCGAALAAIEIAAGLEGDQRRERLLANAARFRAAMADAGFLLLTGAHPIVPVMIEDAALAQQTTARLLARGVYVTAFSYPVVPRGLSRIRVQMSAGIAPEQIDEAVSAFREVGRELGLIGRS